MNHHNCAAFRHVRIRPLQESDIELLRIWRNDSALSAFLRPIGEITPQMQQNWYNEYQQDPETLTFAIEETQSLHRVVGSLSIYDFKDHVSEIGKIVVGDPAAKGKKIGFYAVMLALQIGFQKMDLQRFSCTVHEDNMPSLISHTQAGFLVSGQHPFLKGGNELEMSLTKERFERIHQTVLQEIRLYQA